MSSLPSQKPAASKYNLKVFTSMGALTLPVHFVSKIHVITLSTVFCLLYISKGEQILLELGCTELLIRMML